MCMWVYVLTTPNCCGVFPEISSERLLVAMAESSSSGEESSEEEEHDKTSPSLRGPDSSIATASRQTSEKEQALFSERGYLRTLSRQERRRIKREIRKDRKLGESMILIGIDSFIYWAIPDDDTHTPYGGRLISIEGSILMKFLRVFL